MPRWNCDRDLLTTISGGNASRLDRTRTRGDCGSVAGRRDTARKGWISSGYSKRRTLAREQRVELCNRTRPCRRWRRDFGCFLVAKAPRIRRTPRTLQSCDGRDDGLGLIFASVVPQDLELEH